MIIIPQGNVNIAPMIDWCKANIGYRNIGSVQTQEGRETWGHRWIKGRDGEFLIADKADAIAFRLTFGL